MTILEQELVLALEVASRQNSTGVPWATDSPFQAIINDLLVRAGREPVSSQYEKLVDAE